MTIEQYKEELESLIKRALQAKLDPEDVFTISEDAINEIEVAEPFHVAVKQFERDANAPR